MPSTPDLAPGPGQPALDRSFFGHPRGLSTLFFTEMWERFSYYGMRALLILFMTASVASGGLGFDTAKAGAIYGLYTAGVYLMALPGGYLADRLLGQQRSVFVGGVLIAAGHFAMVFHAVATFYLGLVLIILGTGLLKPNISAIVGDLYGREDERRDAGFSIFYMGINVGGFAAPLLCGYLGEEVDWHLGFGLAGVGMVAGLIQYVAGQRSLPEVGRLPQNPATPAEGRRIWTAVAATLAVAFAAAVAMGLGVFTVDVVKVASVAVVLIASAAALYFAYLLTAGGLDATEKRHVGAVAVLFVFSTFFWLGFEQSGSSMNLFARDMTDRTILGWEFPASWLQFVNSAYLVLLAPVFAALWLRMGRRQPSIPTKFALGLILLGAGFAVLARGAQLAADGTQVGIGWLATAYFLHTCGELCLSPVGLSTVTRLAPQRYASALMGVWFLSISLGSLIAGQIAGQVEAFSMTEIFLGIFVTTAAGGLVLLLLLRRRVIRWMAGAA